MEPRRFSVYLGAALRAARETGGVRPSEIAGALKRDQTTIWRWETGKNWPENPDQVVAVYCDKAGGEPIEIWEDMVRRAGGKAATEPGEEGEGPPPRPDFQRHLPPDDGEALDESA